MTSWTDLEDNWMYECGMLKSSRLEIWEGRVEIVVKAMNFDMITKGVSRKEKFNKRALGSPEFQVLVV